MSKNRHGGKKRQKQRRHFRPQVDIAYMCMPASKGRKASQADYMSKNTEQSVQSARASVAFAWIACSSEAVYNCGIVKPFPK